MKHVFVLLLILLTATLGLLGVGTGPAGAAGPCNPAIQTCL
jgi:hypothetical protein